LRAGDDFGKLVVMLDHVSITVDDIETAEIFYDAVMAALDIPKVKRSKAQLGYGERADANHPGRSYISILRGDRPEPTFRRHWCFKAESRAAGPPPQLSSVLLCRVSH